MGAARSVVAVIAIVSLLALERPARASAEDVAAVSLVVFAILDVAVAITTVVFGIGGSVALATSPRPAELWLTMGWIFGSVVAVIGGFALYLGDKEKDSLVTGIGAAHLVIGLADIAIGTAVMVRRYQTAPRAMLLPTITRRADGSLFAGISLVGITF